MANIKGAEPSPRIVNNILYWYEFNTFTLTWTLNLKDEETQEPIIFNPDDRITFKFFDEMKNVVYTQDFTNIPETNIVELNFDENVTKNFKNGVYTYCIKYNGEYITTIGAVLKVVVERCY